jgi:hypothetical protein
MKYVKYDSSSAEKNAGHLSETYAGLTYAYILYVVRIQTNSVAFSPRANYTDWTTAACRWNLVPAFADRGVSRGQRGGSLRSLIWVF